MTHDDLISVASTWLTRQCQVVVSEIKSNREIPDAFGWCGAKTILVECKVSRSDFKKDSKKKFRTYGGIGYSRYYLSPKDLLKDYEIPVKWGWLETDGTTVTLRKRSEPFQDRNIDAETRLLVSTCRRLGQSAPEGIYAKTYEHFTRRTASIHTSTDPIVDSLTAYIGAYWRSTGEPNAEEMIQEELNRLEAYLTNITNGG